MLLNFLAEARASKCHFWSLQLFRWRWFWPDFDWKLIWIPVRCRLSEFRCLRFLQPDDEDKNRLDLNPCRRYPLGHCKYSKYPLFALGLSILQSPLAVDCLSLLYEFWPLSWTRCVFGLDGPGSYLKLCRIRSNPSFFTSYLRFWTLAPKFPFLGFRFLKFAILICGSKLKSTRILIELTD